MPVPFELQGHRGARGLKPENTLPSFEVAFDLGVSSIETDLHLTRDGVVLVTHEPCVSPLLCRPLNPKDTPEPSPELLVSQLTLAQLRRFRADRNPEPDCYPEQDSGVTPLARLFAQERGIDPLTFPTLAELFAFAQAYVGQLGTAAGKLAAQQTRVSRLRFDLELKRVPFHPEIIGDSFDGTGTGLFEEKLLEVVHKADVAPRTTVRSFDHRSVRVLRQREPRLTGAVLVTGTTPVSPVDLVQAADAQLYCPEYQCLDEAQVRQLHRAGVRVLPWTVNTLADAGMLLEWGVDGLTTDYPNRLAAWLSSRQVDF